MHIWLYSTHSQAQKCHEKMWSDDVWDFLPRISIVCVCVCVFIHDCALFVQFTFQSHPIYDANSDLLMKMVMYAVCLALWLTDCNATWNACACAWPTFENDWKEKPCNFSVRKNISFSRRMYRSENNKCRFDWIHDADQVHLKWSGKRVNKI